MASCSCGDLSTQLVSFLGFASFLHGGAGVTVSMSLQMLLHSAPTLHGCNILQTAAFGVQYMCFAAAGVCQDAPVLLVAYYKQLCRVQEVTLEILLTNSPHIRAHLNMGQIKGNHLYSQEGNMAQQ